jgi:hypothetical protein
MKKQPIAVIQTLAERLAEHARHKSFAGSRTRCRTVDR